MVRDGKAFLTPIETGARAGGRIEVAAGLSEGDRVVVQGGGLLDDGSAVKVVERAGETR